MSKIGENYFRRNGAPVFGIATAWGGPVVVVRLSGHDLSFSSKIFLSQKIPSSHKASLQTLVNEHGQVIDKCLVIYFAAPNSFTGEEVIEFQCHGVKSIVNELVRVLLLNGAQPALPGEFSFRSVLNQKMSLSDAENLNFALKTESLALQDAGDLLFGKEGIESPETQIGFQKLLNQVQRIRGLLEASIDFPEAAQEQKEFVAAFEHQLEVLEKDMSSFLTAVENFSKYGRDEKIVLIFGAPNVGKSTLLNLLVGGERALVSQIPGTTRDLLEVRIKTPKFGWIRVMDSAGIRNSSDSLENLGIQKSQEILERANVGILLNPEGNESPLDSRIQNMKDYFLSRRSLIQLCSFSREPRRSGPGTHAHFFDLVREPAAVKDAIMESLDAILLEANNSASVSLALPDRQVRILKETAFMVGSVRNLLSEEAPVEVVADQLCKIESQIQMARGLGLGEEYISEIFSQFCLGK